MSRQRDILVVDDELVITQAVAKICTAEGLSVDAAAQGRAGLEMLDHCEYRLIVCDIMMTDVDGFQFLEEVARRRVTTPVVMVTGFSTVENTVRSLALGAVDFIPKPFTADELLAIVRRGLRYRALQAKGPMAWVPCPAKYFRLGHVSWLEEEREGTARVGVTDLFLRAVDGVTRVVLPAANDELVQGGPCATLISTDGCAHTVMCPVSGRVVEVNGALATSPDNLEKDPYFGGWLLRMLPSDAALDLPHLTSCSSDRI